MYKTMGHTEQYFVKLYVLFTVFPMNGWGGRAALYQEFYLKIFYISNVNYLTTVQLKNVEKAVRGRVK
jgi:hypothetical protein